MSGGVGSVPALELDHGDYVITPSETKREWGQNLRDMLSGDYDVDDGVHLYDVETATGRRVLEIIDDRRDLKSFSEADGLGDVVRSGMRYGLRSPDGEYHLILDRSGFPSPTYTIREEVDGNPLAALEGSLLPFTDWQLVGPDGSPAATVGRDGRLPSFLSFGYPTYVGHTPDGAEFGRFDVSRLGGSLTGMALHEMAVTLTESTVPPEIGLAAAFGLFREATRSRSSSSGGGGGE